MRNLLVYSLAAIAIIILAGCGTTLTNAARNGDIQQVKTLLDQGADIHEGPPAFIPALMEASREGHIDVVKLLLDRGANVNMKMGARTALAFAAEGRHQDVVKLLLQRGADLDSSILIMKGAPDWWTVDDIEYLREFKNISGYAKEQIINKSINYNGPKEMIAVMDFNAKDVTQSIALSVSELIRNELIKTGRYTVIERSNMNEILKEQGFQQTGCTDTSCAVKLGKLLSAKKILVGTVMKLGSKLIISGRIVDVEKGIGENAASGKADSIDQLDAGVIEFVNNL